MERPTLLQLALYAPNIAEMLHRSMLVAVS
jgi:hypothetical protein